MGREAWPEAVVGCSLHFSSLRHVGLLGWLPKEHKIFWAPSLGLAGRWDTGNPLWWDWEFGDFLLPRLSAGPAAHGHGLRRFAFASFKAHNAEGWFLNLFYILLTLFSRQAIRLSITRRLKAHMWLKKIRHVQSKAKEITTIIKNKAWMFQVFTAPCVEFLLFQMLVFYEHRYKLPNLW